MRSSARTATGWIPWLVVVTLLLVGASPGSYSSTERPLEPPDRSSPRTTLATFLDSIDEAWGLYSNGNPGFEAPFRDARECLSLDDIPPLVRLEASAVAALTLKEVLDRIELPPSDQIPDRAAVEELGLTRWIMPHTEITMTRVHEGDREGEWVFSTGTVARAEEFYTRVRHLPYRQGRSGGHIEELRSGSNAIVMMKLAKAMPPWFRKEIGGMMGWQWFGLLLLVVLLTLAVFAVAWLGRLWRGSGSFGHRLASYLVPLTLIGAAVAGRLMIARLFQLPGAPALVVGLLFSIVGYFGSAWLVALVLTRAGDWIIRLWFHSARPLKKQLVRLVFRIATIVVVTGIVLKAMQIFGVPIAGLIAGLGVGGLAIALAAQGTLENFIGGVVLYADQPVRVGDFCRFGDRLGTIEDVGLRSVKVRTLDESVVTVPNADFAKLHLENLSKRERILLRENICLRYETTGEQLRSILSEFETMLRNHRQIDQEPLRVRFTGFGRYYLEIELYAYALTSVWSEFLSIRQELLVEVMEIVDRSGTRLALPTEVHYSGRDAQRSDVLPTPPEKPA